MWIALQERIWQNPLMDDQFPSSRSNEDIGYRLQLTRRALGYAQVLIAKLANIATTTWNNYETGTRRPSTTEALKMKTRLNLPLDWIYDGDMGKLPAELVEKIYAEHAKDRDDEFNERASPPSRPRPTHPHRRPPRR
jgi:transcriptional regulator with XRE-family HTH domain